jgi:hypothetical protein
LVVFECFAAADTHAFDYPSRLSNHIYRYDAPYNIN